MLIAAWILALLCCVLLSLWIDSMDRAERYRLTVKPRQPELVPLVPTITRRKHNR